MADTNTQEPSWKRFADHEGPDEEDRTNALRRRRMAEGHGGNEFESMMSNTHRKEGTPRGWKHNRKLRV